MSLLHYVNDLYSYQTDEGRRKEDSIADDSSPTTTKKMWIWNVQKFPMRHLLDSFVRVKILCHFLQSKHRLLV